MLHSHTDTSIRLEPWKKFAADGFDVVRKTDIYGVMLQDMSAAEQFIQRYRHQHRVPLTYVHLVIKAAALTARRYPSFNIILARSRCIVPSSIDVGVTIGNDTSLSPVAVLQATDTKSLAGITAELRDKGRLVRQQHEDDLARLNVVGRFIPFSSLRRRILAWTFRSARLRRKFVGTVHIVPHGAPHLDFSLLGFLTTTVVIGVSGISKRAVVIGDCIEARPTAYISFQGDHRILGGRDFHQGSQELNRLLLHPEELDT